MSQWSYPSMLSPWVTHIWICGGVLALFMMGKFGLEHGSGQLFKWRFKLSLSYHKSHCLILVLQQRSCLCREAVCQQQGTCSRSPCCLGAGQSCAGCSQPSLPWQPGDTRMQAGLCAWCQLSPGSPGDPSTPSCSSPQEEASRHLPTPLFNWGGSSCSKTSVNTIATLSRNTSRLQ